MSESGDGTVPSADEGEAKKDKAMDEKVTPKKMADSNAKKDTGEKKPSASPAVSKATPERKNKPTESSKTDVKVKTPVKTPTSNVGTGKDQKTTTKSGISEKSDKSKTKSTVVASDTNLEKSTKSKDISPAAETDKIPKISTKSTPKDEETSKQKDSSPLVDPSEVPLLERKNDLSSETVITSTPDSQQIPRDRKAEAEEEGKEKQQSGGWNWSKWGTSIVDAASSSVSTFSSQVGEGFHTIIETVETSLAGPLPEDMDEQERRMYEEQGMGDAFNPEVVQSTTAGVTNLTKKVQDKGKSIVTGGLDVLETIGKKTYDVITEHDPGLKRTRNVLFDRGVKPNLSYILREAKEHADEAAAMKKEAEEARKVHFGAMFDEYQGLAHLEALEILSNQSEKRVQSLLGAMPLEALDSIKQELITIKQVFELDEEEEDEGQEHNFVKLITDNLLDLHLGTTPDKLNKAHEKIRQWIADFYEKDEKEEKTPSKVRLAYKSLMGLSEIHEAAIQALAEMTAKSVEQFHKAGELILLKKDANKTFLERAKCLASLTKVLCTEAGILSSKFVKCLNKVAESAESEDSHKITMMVTNVYLEATNSSTYTQDAFQLLLPVLQQGVIENSEVLTQ
ncbi:hypothetical protein ScPMuIL_010948 [Solemya velum]